MESGLLRAGVIEPQQQLGQPGLNSLDSHPAQSALAVNFVKISSQTASTTVTGSRWPARHSPPVWLDTRRSRTRFSCGSASPKQPLYHLLHRHGQRAVAVKPLPHHQPHHYR